MKRAEKKPDPFLGTRCRVALLPDCHVQDGGGELPSRPTRRLYGAARVLLESCLGRLAEMNVDAVLLLGDTLDPADAKGVRWLRSLIDKCPMPVYVIVGNHELYGPVSFAEFHKALGLPVAGNYVAWINDVPFVMLATPDQHSFAPGSDEFRWLRQTLQQLTAAPNVFCCAHFSLLLHPCVQGPRNDGMQVLWFGNEIMTLLAQFPNVRAWIAGHKNVPSKVERNGMLHLLSPQLIQAPCAFRMLDVHDNRIDSKIHEIQERELSELSRRAYGAEYSDRYGRPEDRDFSWSL